MFSDLMQRFSNAIGSEYNEYKWKWYYWIDNFYCIGAYSILSDKYSCFILEWKTKTINWECVYGLKRTIGWNRRCLLLLLILRHQFWKVIVEFTGANIAAIVRWEIADAWVNVIAKWYVLQATGKRTCEFIMSTIGYGNVVGETTCWSTRGRKKSNLWTETTIAIHTAFKRFFSF